MNYAIYIAAIIVVLLGLILYFRWRRVEALIQKRKEIDLMYNREEIDSMTYCGLPLGDIHFSRNLTTTAQKK